MPIRPISIPSLDYSLAADWHEGRGSGPVLLVLTGFGSSKQRYIDFVSRVVDESGHDALVVDLSGHGESPFELDDTTPAQHLIDAISTYDWLRSTHPDRQIDVLGTSYGGFIASLLSKFRPVRRLILRTPAIYEPTSFYTRHEHIDKVGILSYRNDRDALLLNPVFATPSFTETRTFMVIHGNDADIPPTTTDVYREVFRAETYTAEGFVHSMRDPSNPRDRLDGYYQVIRDWLT